MAEAKGFWDNINFGDILSSIAPTLIRSGMGVYNNMSNQQANAQNLQNQWDREDQQAAQEFQRQTDLLKLKAALDSAGGAAGAGAEATKYAARLRALADIMGAQNQAAQVKTNSMANIISAIQNPYK